MGLIIIAKLLFSNKLISAKWLAYYLYSIDVTFNLLTEINTFFKCVFVVMYAQVCGNVHPINACVETRGGSQVSLVPSGFVSGDRALTEPGDDHFLLG